MLQRLSRLLRCNNITPGSSRHKLNVHFQCWRCLTSVVPQDDVDAAEVVWEYLQMHHTLAKSDIILVCGNHDKRTAAHASALYMKGLADLILFSGKEGVLTTGKWKKSEAEVFRDVAIAKGVPQKSILIEPHATNTGENITFSYEVLRSHNLLKHLNKFLLIQMPHMERRVYATFMKQWPGDTTNMNVLVSSPRIPLIKYPNHHVGSLSSVITVMMGCLNRVHTYPKKGFQISQDIPENVWQSYLHLLDTGQYSNHIPMDELGQTINMK